jgi:hypothetical protein
MQLSKAPTWVPYNPLEKAFFAAIPQDGKRINLKQLIFVRLQHDPVWNVKHPRNIISTQMIRLAEKIEQNQEPFRLCREGNRREQVWYWLERVKRTRPSSRAGSTRIALFD